MQCRGGARLPFVRLTVAFWEVAVIFWEVAVTFWEVGGCFCGMWRLLLRNVAATCGSPGGMDGPPETELPVDLLMITGPAELNYQADNL